MRHRRKILIAVGIALGAAILIPVIHHYQLRAATEAYIAQLKTQGEPMELAQVIPPPVPPEKNGALLITNALSQLYYFDDTSTSLAIDLTINNPPEEMNRTIPGKEMIGWNEPVIHDPNGNWPTNSWADLADQLAERRSKLDAFRQLVAKPLLDFNYDYGSPELYVPELAAHLGAIKQAGQWLEASEYYQLHLGNTAAACADVRAMLAFVKGEAGERLEICQLIRFAVTGMSADATWDILQSTNVSNEELAQLQQDWQSLEFTTPLKNAFLFERVNELRLLNNLRQSPTNFSQSFGSVYVAKGYRYEQRGTGSLAQWVLVDKSSFPKRIMNKISIAWDEAQWRWFWSYPDEVRALKMWQTVIQGTQMLETNRSFPAVQLFVKANFARQGFNSLNKDPYAVFSYNASIQLSAISRLATVETVRNIVITAIALKRYESRHHRLPASLDELVPDFMGSVSTDYMDGQPLRYRKNANGTFLLYSVGENGKDDGGNPALEPNVESSNYYWQNPQALDWVWPQPATEAEIQSYYAHPPK